MISLLLGFLGPTQRLRDASMDWNRVGTSQQQWRRVPVRADQRSAVMACGDCAQALFVARGRGASMHSTRVSKRRHIAQLGLEDHRTKRVRQLSKGNLQRLGLAQAMLTDARVVVLDEPTHGLDPVWTQRFRDIVVALRRPDRTILIASHNLDELARLADRVGIIDHGQLQRIVDVRTRQRAERLGGRAVPRRSFARGEAGCVNARFPDGAQRWAWRVRAVGRFARGDQSRHRGAHRTKACAVQRWSIRCALGAGAAVSGSSGFGEGRAMSASMTPRSSSGGAAPARCGTIQALASARLPEESRPADDHRLGADAGYVTLGPMLVNVPTPACRDPATASSSRKLRRYRRRARAVLLGDRQRVVPAHDPGRPHLSRGVLFATNGIVADDRKQGYYRFLFSRKPVSSRRGTMARRSPSTGSASSSWRRGCHCSTHTSWCRCSRCR